MSEGPTSSGAISSTGRSFEPLTNATRPLSAIREMSIDSMSRVDRVCARRALCFADSSLLLMPRSISRAESTLSRSVISALWISSGSGMDSRLSTNGDNCACRSLAIWLSEPLTASSRIIARIEAETALTRPGPISVLTEALMTSSS